MFQRWLDRFLEMLRGSSREPDDLALGTTRPGDFIEPKEGEELILPNPHDEDERQDDGTP
jgi:hypothetical protein